MDPLPDRVETVAALDDHLPGIGAFSTLCVYPFADISGPGWDEAAPLTPVGEYANSCVGRERVFQHGSERYGTPDRLIRLNYAIDLRYGHPARNSVPSATAGTHRPHHPPGQYHLAGRRRSADPPHLAPLHYADQPTQHRRSRPRGHRGLGVSFRGAIRQRAHLAGHLATTAWINNTAQAARLFGPPTITPDQMVAWTADWVAQGGASGRYWHDHRLCRDSAGGDLRRGDRRGMAAGTYYLDSGEDPRRAARIAADGAG